MSALKIAMLTTFYPPYNFGGDGIGIKRLTTALADLGHQVTVIHDRDAYLSLAGKKPAPIAEDPRVNVIGLKSSLGIVSSLMVQQLGSPVAHKGELEKLLGPGQFDVIWYLAN